MTPKPGKQPQLSWSDASLLEAMLTCGRRASPLGVAELLREVEWEDRATAWFGMFRWGVPRLEAAGWVTSEIDTDGDLRLRLTARAEALDREAPKDGFPGRGDRTEWLESRLGTDPPWSSSVGDRSLGPLAGYTEEAFARARRRYTDEMDEATRWPVTYRLSDGQEVELGRSGDITADDLDRLHAALRKARDTGPLTRSRALRRRLRSNR